MKKSIFYITTPLYYVNDEPHIGHAYTTILADVISRFQRSLENDVYFLTGTDEHGQKVQEASEKKGVSPQNHADKYVRRFIDLWKKLNINYDDFIRTTEKRHTDRVKDLLMILWEKGEIYQDEYEGLYSVSEERFITEKEYETGEFRGVKKIKEKNYFFKMSKYQNELIKHINENPTFIQPETRKNEILGFLNNPLNDLCISRPKSRLTWGIDLPFDDKYVTYVWFDALTNYISSIGWNIDENKFNSLWPANYHLIGKDIITTHAVFWSTMLLASDIKLPKAIFAHGWWLIDNTKISKSLGNVVKPLDLVDEFGADAVRYYLMRNMVLGQDANFTYESFVKRYNSDLANNYGNVVNRVLVLIEKYFNSKIPSPGDYDEIDIKLASNFKSIYIKISKLIENLKIHDVVELIFSLIRLINKYLEDKAPWKTFKEYPNEKEITATTLFIAIESIRICTLLLHPIMPSKTRIVLNAIGVQNMNIKALSFGKIIPGQKIELITTLFPRIEL